jgi:hypothetical protein
MLFSLPQEFTESSNFRSICVNITMTADKIVDGIFQFKNSLWDELVGQMEFDEDNDEGEMLNSKNTMKKIFAALHKPGSKLLTQIRPEEWQRYEIMFETGENDVLITGPSGNGVDLHDRNNESDDVASGGDDDVEADDNDDIDDDGDDDGDVEVDDDANEDANDDEAIDDQEVVEEADAVNGEATTEESVNDEEGGSADQAGVVATEADAA